MKKSLYLITLASILCGCSSKKIDTPYEISGDVKNLSADMVYLRIKKTAPDGHIYWPKIDSAEVNDGSFTLNRDSSIKEPSMAMITYKNNDQRPTSIKFFNAHDQVNLDHFILENAKITVDGDLEQPNSVLIKGSRETDFLYQHQRKFFRRILIVDLKVDSILKTKTNLGLKKLYEERAQLRAPLNAEIKTILSANKDVHQTVHLLYNNQRSFGGTELEEFASLLDKKLLNSAEGAQLKKVIELKKSQEVTN